MDINLKLNSKEIIMNLKCKFQSIRIKLFVALCTTIAIIVLFLILINSVVLETYYIYSKQSMLLKAYRGINDYYNNAINSTNIEVQLERLSASNDFDILIKTDDSIYSTSRDFISTLVTADSKKNIFNERWLNSDENVEMKIMEDKQTGLSFILLSSTLDNGYQLYIRVAVASIQSSVKIANRFLMLMGGIATIVSGFVALIISRKFTSPIEELNNVTKRIAKLDFSQKYNVNNSEDELNYLGRNINTMSDTLEKTIKQLRNSNIELEKDIEEKSRTDEMRKQFISDVSHELKTPIALIQGYAEGLVENVVEDEESKKFYAEVILDEANKMDIVVKKLLELMKLEYGKNAFNLTKFNISELIHEVIRKSKKMLDEEKININFNDEAIYVVADEFYIEQVFNNYFTNAIKNTTKIDDVKEIKIDYEIKKEKLRVKIFNTGENIAEEDLNRIWNRFYKVDTSRNREQGGTGIGLSLVRAIMTNTGNEYGVQNKIGGVEFYFEIDIAGQ